MTVRSFTSVYVSQSPSLLIILSLRTNGGGVVGGDSRHHCIEGVGDEGLLHIVTKEDDVGLLVEDSLWELSFLHRAWLEHVVNDGIYGR